MMRKLLDRYTPRGYRRSCRCCFPVYCLAPIIAVASLVLAPGRAHADSVIDARVQPYFMLGGWATALVFLGLGFFVLRKAIRNRRMAAAAARWPTCNGRVVSTDVVKRVSKSAEQQFEYFVPQVRYEYMANGIRCQGDVIRIGLDEMGYPEEKKAREHVALYPVGKTIAVRYDAQNPDQSVLETGQVGVVRKMVAGVILAGVGIAAMAFAIWIGSLPSR